uniref:PKD_channel domain-containing protein n=1 Tax=Heterorhabditis bacteriophora TaxID=37862 RepID=A0A1I7X3A0_HETBA
MSQLSITLSRSAKDIGAFVIMFIIFFSAFIQFAHLVFGSQISNYSTFYNTIFTLLRILLGDFDFHALKKANHIFGPLFFVTYIILVHYILMNMFLAIINDSYADVMTQLTRNRLTAFNGKVVNCIFVSPINYNVHYTISTSICNFLFVIASR